MGKNCGFFNKSIFLCVLFLQQTLFINFPIHPLFELAFLCIHFVIFKAFNFDFSVDLLRKTKLAQNVPILNISQQNIKLSTTLIDFYKLLNHHSYTIHHGNSIAHSIYVCTLSNNFSSLWCIASRFWTFEIQMTENFLFM